MGGLTEKWAEILLSQIHIVLLEINRKELLRQSKLMSAVTDLVLLQDIGKANV